MCHLGINNTCNVKSRNLERCQTNHKQADLFRMNNDFNGLLRHCFIIAHKTFIYFTSVPLGCYNYLHESSSVFTSSITFIAGSIPSSPSDAGAGNVSGLG